VLRETINVGVGTDATAVVSGLRNKFANAGVTPLETDVTLRQIGETVATLIEHGKRIAAAGSQMEVTREFTGEGYLIRIIFREGVKRTVFQKLFDRFRR